MSNLFTVQSTLTYYILRIIFFTMIFKMICVCNQVSKQGIMYWNAEIGVQTLRVTGQDSVIQFTGHWSYTHCLVSHTLNTRAVHPLGTLNIGMGGGGILCNFSKFWWISDFRGRFSIKFFEKSEIFGGCIPTPIPPCLCTHALSLALFGWGLSYYSTNNLVSIKVNHLQYSWIV